MKDVDQFIAQCCEAVENDTSHRAAREVVARAVSDPNKVLAALGEPSQAGVTPLHHSASVTILNVVWGPLMNIPAHNHEMWAVIGIYAGREDSILWRRIDDENGQSIEAAGATSLATKDTEPLGKDIIHSVVNPVNRLTAAIHVYGGDFFGVERQEWDPETHEERPFDFDRTRQYFEKSNRLLTESQG